MLLGELLGPDGLIVLAVVVLVLLFGGTKLPQLARSLGSAKKEFEQGRSEGDATLASGASTDGPTS